jgi:hypothetical protein
MGRFERLRDLPGDRQCVVERDRSPRDPLRQILALNEFHHERAYAAGVFQAVDVRDIGMLSDASVWASRVNRAAGLDRTNGECEAPPCYSDNTPAV